MTFLFQLGLHILSPNSWLSAHAERTRESRRRGGREREMEREMAREREKGSEREMA